jgi:Zn-dependent M16 (insulinase) family peptidase
LPAYLQSFFSLPVVRKDGQRLKYTEVVQELDRETVEYDINLGSPITQTVEMYLKVEKSKYATAVGWLGDLLWRSQFDADRLRISTAKILQTLPARKREGSDVSAALYDDLIFDPDRAPMAANNLFKQESCLPAVLEKLKSDPDAVIAQMEQLRTHRPFFFFFSLSLQVRHTLIAYLL